MSDWQSLTNDLNRAALGTFGRAVTYLPFDSEGVAVPGIVEIGKDTEETVPGTYAVLFLHLADLPSAPQRGDRVAIGNLIYVVFDIEADAGGGAVLRLRQA